MLKKVILFCGIGFILKKLLESDVIELPGSLKGGIESLLDIPLKQVEKSMDDIFE